MLHTHKPQTDTDIKEMAERNEARRTIIKRVMGTKLMTHRANHIRRVDAKKPFDDIYHEKFTGNMLSMIRL